MDKVKKILEGYVEWIALGLGACFLLWMVYSYVYLPPVTVPVGPLPAVLPSAIDSQIWEGQGRMLKAQIDQRVPPVKVAVPLFSESVATSLAQQAPGTSNMKFVWTTDVMPPALNAVAVRGPEITVAGARVTALPSAPKPVNIATSNGHSNTLAVADTSTGAAAAVGPGATPMSGGMPGMVPGGALPVANQATDKGWVTVAVTVPSSTALNDEFTKANIPAQIQLRQTTMLRVELFREEMLPTGSWGPEVLIEPPPIDVLPTMPPAVANSAVAARMQQSYRDFASKQAPLILRPAFFQIVQGDKWFMPGTPNPNVKVDELVEDKFDPAKYLTGSLDGLDKDQRAQVYKLRQETAAAERKAKAALDAQARKDRAAASRNNRGRSGSTPPGPGGVTPTPGFVVADADRSSAVAMADGPSMFDVPPRVPQQGNPDGPSPMDMPGMPGVPNADGTTPGGNLPNGSFDPAMQKDFVVWSHDDTVKPGKTYRYRVRYAISSPVYGTMQLCKPQALAAQFTIMSEKSDWSAPVNIESDSNFYASAVGTRGSVTMDVFKWQNGIWTMKTVNVEPGDTIDGTDWTVVDVRNLQPTNAQVILASDNGTLEREVATDKKNKTYHDLIVRVHGPATPQQGQGADPGMMPPQGRVPPMSGM